MSHPPELLLFLGRFHPLLVHLPIGMLAALAVLEMAAWLPRFKHANTSAGYIIALAAPAAVAAAVCGWLLSLAGGYDAELLAWHKWLGTATAAGSVLAAGLYWRKKLNLYRIALFGTVALLMAAGHLGGSLTHGSDYLGRYAPGPLKPLLGAADRKTSSAKQGDLNQVPVFAGVIQPILELRCVECHGATKSKASLRLDSFSALLKGSENGAVVQPGNLAHSPLMQRVLLPADSDDHMPPNGKPQLTAGEITLLKWWVSIGAPEMETVTALKPPFEIQQLLSGKSAGIPSAN